jgi:hypothetical protein
MISFVGVEAKSERVTTSHPLTIDKQLPSSAENIRHLRKDFNETEK